MKKFSKTAKAAVSIVIATLMAVTSLFTVSAEGGSSLNKNPDNISSACRMNTEWENNKTIGLDRKTTIYVYAFKGETVYFGSSVYNSQINLEGTKSTGKVTGNDIVVTDPHGNVTPYDVQNTGNQTGYIGTTAKEKAGAYIEGINESTNAYKPLSFTAETSGVYEFHFHSQTGNDSGGAHAVKLNGSFNQKTSKVAAWDVEVSNGTSIKTGRTYANYLALDTGSFDAVAYSTVYVLTDDGYKYKIDLNGFSPYGYILFANNRGICTVGTDSKPIYHSIASTDLLADTTNVEKRNGVQYKLPGSVNTELDQSYKIFFEEPSADLEGIVYSSPQEPSTIENLKFHGSKIDNISYVDQGGYFTFDIASGSSVTIAMDFGDGNTVTLSNSVIPGKNSFYWDGKFDDGTIVPVGKYKMSDIFVTSMVKAGEIHFPMVDVEGIKDITVTRLNGSDMTDNTLLYYNNLPLTNNVISLDETPVSLGSNKYQLSDGTSTYYKYTGITDPDGTAGVDTAASTNTLEMSYNNNTPHMGGNDAIIDTWTYYPGEKLTQKLSTDEEIEIIDDGNTSMVSGMVFFDANNNGGSCSPSEGDYGMANVTVNLCNPSGKVIDTAVTSLSGTYHFYGVKNGKYTVVSEVNTNVYTNTTNNDKQDITIETPVETQSMIDMQANTVSLLSVRRGANGVQQYNASDIGYYYESGAKDIIVQKKWANNLPTLNSIHVQLYAQYTDGDGQTHTVDIEKQATLSAANGWSYTYSNLPSTINGYAAQFYMTESYYNNNRGEEVVIGTSQIIGDPDTLTYSSGANEDGYEATFNWSVRSSTEYQVIITNTSPSDYLVTFHSNMDGIADVFKTYAKSDSAYTHSADLTSDCKIEEFTEIPVCKDENNTYIFKGWYYADGTALKWNTDKYYMTTDIYAQWERIGTVAKDSADEKLTSSANYSGFDLFGMQIRTSKYDITDGSGTVTKQVSGMRYITSYSNSLVTNLDNLFKGKQYGSYTHSDLEYGYAVAKQDKLAAAGYSTDYKVTTNCPVAAKIDCTRDITTAFPVTPDHRNYSNYRISSMVIMYNSDSSKPQADIEAAKAANVVARPYIIYTDANGLQRTVYNTYTGTSLLYGGCCTNYNKVLGSVQPDPDHKVD